MLNTHKLLMGASILSSAMGFYAQKSPANFKALERDKNVKPRNVIFILTDYHRYDFMGFTGKVSWLETPNMDRLAAERAYFKNAFVTTSFCSPSRASHWQNGKFYHFTSVQYPLSDLAASLNPKMHPVITF